MPYASPLLPLNPRHIPLLLVGLTAALFSTACEPADESAGDAGNRDGGAAPDAAAPTAQVLTHTFPTETVQPGAEDTGLCYSWTLGNEDALLVNRVSSRNEGGFHHSNWFAVSEDMFGGPDGAWRCADRGFDTVVAGLEGEVIFAQSTQVEEETQEFPRNAVVRIPPHSRIIGQVHLLSFERSPIETSFMLELEALDAADAGPVLRQVVLSNFALEIGPRETVSYEMDCDIGLPQDFSVYFVLPHYHELGTQFELDVETTEGWQPVVSTRARAGEPLGQVLDPPMRFERVERMRMRCAYENTSSERFEYGFGEGEMCVFLGFTDARRRIAGIGRTNEGRTASGDTVRTTCAALSL